MEAPVQHILIIRFGAIGDVALLVPVLVNATLQNKHLHFTLLTKKGNGFLFAHIPHLTVIEAHTNSQHKGLLGLYKLRQLINTQSYTAIIDMHDVLRSKVITSLIKAPTKILFDKAREDKQAYLKHRKGSVSPTINRYLAAMHEAGIPCTLNATPPFINTPQVIPLPQYMSDNKPIVALAPFATHACKSMDLPFIHLLIADITNRLDYNVLLLLGKEHQAISDELCELPNVYNCLNYSFAQQVSLMQYCKAAIAVDSSNMHIAALQGIPLISIWYATSPHLGFAPYTHGQHITISAQALDTPCSPCSVFGNKACSNKANPLICKQNINVQVIVQALLAIN
jgi:ADP-heptose:LPS heptosyltransferase